MGEVGQALLQERLALHEALRVGLAREDDLKLLQQVAQGQLELPPASLQQLFKEVSLREEWRVSREQQLQQQLQASTLRCVRDRDICHIKQLTQQVQQMQLRQAQAGRAQPHRRQPPPSHAAPSYINHAAAFMVSAATSAAGSNPAQQLTTLPPPAGSHSSLNAALSIYQGSKVAKAAAITAAVHGAASSKAGSRPGALTAEPGTPVAAQRKARPVSSTGSGAVTAVERGSVKLVRTISEAAQNSKGRTTAGARFSRTLSNAHTQQQQQQQQHMPQLLTADQLRQQLMQHAHRNQACNTAGTGADRTSLAMKHSADANSNRSLATIPSTADMGHTDMTKRHSAGETGSTEQRPAGGAAATSQKLASTAVLKQRTISQPMLPTHDRPATAPVPSGCAAVHQEPVRFQKLLHLQGMLLTGLQQHVEGSGVTAACAALVDSLQHMQQHFAACLAEAMRMAHEAAGNPPSPQLGHARSVASWGRLLLLGQLALTPADIARLTVLRQHIAARNIQRAVRRYLQRQRAAAVAREAAAKAAAAVHRLHSHAALVVQRYWRGHMGRKAAHQRALQAMQERRKKALLTAQQLIAAVKIQRAWRGHVKQRRALQALAKPVGDHAVQTVEQLGLASSTQSNYMADTSGDITQDQDQQQQRVLRGIVRLQALVRGWLVRRSVGLWWTRSIAQLRRRRAAARAWRAHQAYLMVALPLQEQYIASLEAEERMAQAAMQAAHKEQAAVEQAWQAWLQRQLATALAQPLPRGWVPHAPTQGYLDTRTGALHAHHPAELQLHSFAATQHQAAVNQLQRSLSALQQRVEQQHEAGVQQRLELIHGMYKSMVAHLGDA